MSTFLLFLLSVCTFNASAACVDRDPNTPIPPITLEQIAEGLDHPTHIAHAGDGSKRLFVVEQRGTIRIIENGKLQAESFLDIRDRVQDGNGELGLLSIAFHPRYRDNGIFYVYYTSPIGHLRSRTSRWRRADPHHADPASEDILLEIDKPYSNHNGGQLAFGPDGFLYIGVGDGGAANDPQDHGQNPGSLLGKLLRIDVNSKQPPLPYAIPKDNPFTRKQGTRGEIWAIGLRNPWRFSFDRKTGTLFLADVGQDHVEEINVIRKGGNYGWNIMEGDICTPAVNPRCDKRGLESPVHVYRRPQGFSVTGGFVYRGSAIPDLCGAYVYADYAARRVWGLRYDGTRVTLNRELLDRGSGTPTISSFGEDEQGELYVADHENGRVLKIVAARASGR